MSDDFFRKYNKNVFEGEDCSITNPELTKARAKNDAQKWDYHKQHLLELARKSNPMLKRKNKE